MAWDSDFGARGFDSDSDGWGDNRWDGSLSRHCDGEEGRLRTDVRRSVDHSWVSRRLVGSIRLHRLDRRSACGGLFVHIVCSVFADSPRQHGIGARTLASTVEGVNVPSNLRYTKDHEWVLVAGSTVRVGITDYAQDALGDIVFIQLPDVGSDVSAHQGLGEIESTKSVNDVYAPVAGKVLAVNSALVDHPELLNSDPYESGWICEIEVNDLDETGLMSSEEYAALIGA